jgi:restriction system protein
MLPLLRFAGDGAEHQLKEAVHSLASEFSLSESEKNEFLPSGQQPVFTNRIGWARTYLKKAGLLASPKRGYFQITSRGKTVLKEKPEQINQKYLERFPEFLEFKNFKRDKEDSGTEEPNEATSGQTPHEALDSAYERLRAELAAEILANVKACDPTLFENIVVELLVKMGYGGNRKDAGRAIGRSGDEGIDGIIKEDPLGLDIIYLQAKRWEGTVGRPEIQKFAGALQGQRTRKGIFITTSTFSSDALEYTSRIETKIILIDGLRLAKLMFDHGVGVSAASNYEVKRIDTDYFTDT